MEAWLETTNEKLARDAYRTAYPRHDGLRGRTLRQTESTCSEAFRALAPTPQHRVLQQISPAAMISMCAGFTKERVHDGV